MKNRLDFKSFIIGFLICLCGFLMLGFGGNSDSGRYIRFGDKNLMIDTNTGRIRPVYFNGQLLWDTPFEQLSLNTKPTDSQRAEIIENVKKLAEEAERLQKEANQKVTE
jgi:hypothetical protein